MGTLSVDKLVKTSSGAAEFTLPATDGAAGAVLQTDGSGQLSVATVGSSGIATDAVGSSQIAANAVTATEIAATTITPAQMANSAFLANRNMIINGAMQIAQRGTTAAGTTSNTYSQLDRWGLGSGSSFNFDVTATTNTTTVNTEDGFASALMITPDSTQTPTGSHNATIYYLMEGYDAQRLKQGGANAETFTLSFYANAVGKTGVYSVCCIKKDAAGAARYQVKEFTVTTSWVRHTITFEADTTALIRNSNASALNFYFSMACGPDDIVAPTTAWATGGGIAAGTNQVNFMDSTSNEFHITGVQLEVGSNATPFEHKTFAQDLQACQRYYEKSYNQGVALGSNTNVGAYRPRHPSAGTNGSPISFRVSKRTTPTIVFYSRNTGATGKVTNMSGGASDINCATEGYAGEWNTVANYTSSGSETNVEGHWTADAEL